MSRPPPARRLTIEPPHRRSSKTGSIASRTEGSRSPFFPPPAGAAGPSSAVDHGASRSGEPRQVGRMFSNGFDDPIELLDDDDDDGEEEDNEDDGVAFGGDGQVRTRSNIAGIDNEDLEEYEEIIAVSASRQAVKRERQSDGTSEGVSNGQTPLGLEEKDGIKRKVAQLRAELEDLERQIQPLLAVRSSLTADLSLLTARLSHSSSTNTAASLSSKSGTVQGRSFASTAKTDYHTPTFPWSSSLLAVLQRRFQLASFRLCQEGAINAALDDRDVLCVMPTGGGKSLTYQLPACMGTKGVTVVVSPLLALIWDQVRALKEKGIECAMLTGNTSKEEQSMIYKRMESGEGKEIRLCYVTPEKISKSKRFMSVLEKVNSGGRLKRFVIDEAHCCSQLGHDFRPDYRKLSTLKTLFPHVPIQAVTATLSNKTLPDLLKILKLKPITDGHTANSSGTVFFSSPLYRPNLKYQVRTKPKDPKAVIEAVGQWIEEHHPKESGIIYCLSKKDAEMVAEALREWSQGRIKTGVYHADVGEYEKEQIHTRWREGRVNVICATIAFGLGIDKGDVRYVIHHSMSKTLEGYYQETGRAGRDGKDSDCVLFYRGQDATRMSSLIYSDVDGGSKLKEMLRFAQDMVTCRKVAFARYFSTSSHVSAAAWDNPLPLTSSSISTSSQPHTLTKCGSCDNCRRPADSVQLLDCTVDAWRVLKVAQIIELEHGRVTLVSLADIVRGLGGGAFGIFGGKKGRQEGDKSKVDVVAETGGKVGLSREDTESLLIWLLLDGYLTESYHATAYTVNVYLVPSTNATRLTRLTLDRLEAGHTAVKIEYTFPTTPSKAAKSKKPSKRAAAATQEEEQDDETAKDQSNKKRRTVKASPSRTREKATQDVPQKKALAAFPLQPLEDSDSEEFDPGIEMEDVFADGSDLLDDP